MKHQLVQIIWHDAHSVCETWTTKGEIDVAPCIVSSVGWVIESVKADHVVIAQSRILDDDHYDHVLAIPTGMIKQINRLKATRVLPVGDDGFQVESTDH